MSKVRTGRLAGKNAVVTGAAGDIGLETCMLFAREGANVLMAGRTTESLAAACDRVRELAVADARIDYVQCDVSNEADVQTLIGKVDAWGGLDVLFNNAAVVSPDDAGVVETTDEAWDLTHAINVKGVWYGCKHAVLSFRRHGKDRASVINNASIVGLVGSAVPQLAYTASKGAVMAMTRELAVAHAREGFRFNSLCPGPVRTSVLDTLMGDNPDMLARREVHWPTGRLSECIEQAHAVLFLASDDSSFVNGIDFVVDGALTKAYVTAKGPPTKAPNNFSTT